MPPRQNDTRSSASQQRPSRNGGQNRNGQRSGAAPGNQRTNSNSRVKGSHTTQRRVQPAASGPIPLWAWIILILIIGVLLGKHFLSSSQPAQPQEGNASIMTRSTNGSVVDNGTSSEQKSDNGQPSADTTTKMPSFEFYTLLPESEVIAPDVPSTQNNSGSSSSSAGSSTTRSASSGSTNSGSTSSGSSNTDNGSAGNTSRVTASSTPANATHNNRTTTSTQQQSTSTNPPRQTASTGNNTTASTSNGSDTSSSFGGVSYMLQAASFKSQSDANNMANSFRQMGLTMQVTQVQTSDGTTWYRVQAGPFTDSNALKRARGIMQTKGIDALTIRRR